MKSFNGGLDGQGEGEWGVQRAEEEMIRRGEEGGGGGDVLCPRVYTGPWVLGAPGSGHSAPCSSGHYKQDCLKTQGDI